MNEIKFPEVYFKDDKRLLQSVPAKIVFVKKISDPNFDQNSKIHPRNFRLIFFIIITALRPEKLYLVGLFDIQKIN